MQPVQVDRGEYVRHFGCNVELGEQFDLAAGDARVHMQLSSDRNKIFLKNLQMTRLRSSAAGALLQVPMRDVVSRA